MSVMATIEENTFRVRQDCSVEIAVRSERELAPGDTVEVQFPNSWTIVSGPSFTRPLQTTDPAGEHHLSVSAPGCEAQFSVEIRKRHLNLPEREGRHGRHIVATLTQGRVPAGSPIRVVYANTCAPYVAETETVWLRVGGQAPEAVPTLIVTPGVATCMRIIVPSGVEPGETFDVLVVSLDEFENCSCTQYENETLMLDDGRLIAGGLNFVGSVRVPASLSDEGVYRFRMGDVVSNAVRVAKGRRGPYWGDIHIHTKLSSDAMGTDPYEYARQVSGLDFAGAADHWDSLGDLGYRQTLDWVEEAYEPGKFVSIPADERNPAGWTGHHNIYFRNPTDLLKYAAKPGRQTPLPEDPSVAMLIPHHTGIAWGGGPTAGVGAAVDVDAVDDRGLRPVVEIYSHHGQSELYDPQHILAYEFNRMRNPERRANTSVAGPFYAQDYWMMGRRFGVIGSSDEHSGQGGRRHGGLAAVWAEELTREAIFDAVRERRCYATTGERILVDFSVDGVPMGGRAKRSKGSKLKIRLQVWGTDLLLRVEILRHRFGVDKGFLPVLSVPPRPESMDAGFGIEDEFTGDAVYYARITQEPLEWPAMAWTSPVWIDAE